MSSSYYPEGYIDGRQPIQAVVDGVLDTSGLTGKRVDELQSELMEDIVAKQGAGTSVDPWPDAQHPLAPAV